MKILIIIRPGKSLKKLGSIDPKNEVQFPLEFLKSRMSSGMATYELKLKFYFSIILTRNFNSSQEPCSEMRIIIIIIIIIIINTGTNMFQNQ
jgi:hypothetical protein